MVQIVFARKDGGAAQQFGQNTANGPDVDFLRIMRGVEYDFRGSVPPRYNLFGQDSPTVDVSASRKPKVADFEVTILVEEKIGGLQVTVNDHAGVHVEDTPQQLLDELLDVLVC